MQIKNAEKDGFALWLQARSIDLNTFLHRELVQQLFGSRDKIAVAIAANMFSVTDTFTCFPEGEFTPREKLWNIETQNAVCDFILVSSDTSLRLPRAVTPNISTDGSFPKTWRYENGEWWLYKLQGIDATHSEYAISRALRACGWAAAEYHYMKGRKPTNRIKTRNFVRQGEFFEPYDSLRHMFYDKSDRSDVIYANIQSLGVAFEKAYRRILLADGLFMNSDRHMRNFGVIRSSINGEVLRMAPNFDNNQAYKSNKAFRYSGAILQGFVSEFGFSEADKSDLRALADACAGTPYLREAQGVARELLSRLG